MRHGEEHKVGGFILNKRRKNMKIEPIQGRKARDDRLFLVTTEEREPVTIFKVAVLVNQLAMNEMILHGHRMKNGFFFKEAIDYAIADGSKLINWGEPINQAQVIDTFKTRWFFQDKHIQEIEKDLRRCFQTALNDFEVEK
jgi:hypothetical protein